MHLIGLFLRLDLERSKGAEIVHSPNGGLTPNFPLDAVGSRLCSSRTITVEWLRES